MIGLGDLKLVYLASCVLLGLIILSPTLALVVRVPGGEKFSELWILGPGHMVEDYPHNVSAGNVYSVNLGIGNHLGGLKYYLVYVKLRNQTEPAPDSLNGTPSGLAPLFEYRVFLGDGDVWEREVSFSFDGVSFEGDLCRVSKLSIDGSAFSVDKVAVRDQVNNGFYLQLFFELWLYNATASGFQFHDRAVWNWLNVTRSM